MGALKRLKKRGSINKITNSIATLAKTLAELVATVQFIVYAISILIEKGIITDKEIKDAIKKHDNNEPEENRKTDSVQPEESGTNEISG